MPTDNVFNDANVNSSVPTQDYAKILAEHAHLFDELENAKLVKYSEYQSQQASNTYRFSEIGERDISGFPCCVTRGADGELRATFTEDKHGLVVGATRSGKTTGFVIPFAFLMSLKKNKPNLFFSDPKGELYEQCCAHLIKQGYDIKRLDFLEYRSSELWNSLTKIFRRYQAYLGVEDEVGVVIIDGEYYNTFKGEIYDDQDELDEVIAEEKDSLFADVDNMIISFADKSCPVLKDSDPYWDMMSSNLLQGFLWALLEDSSEHQTTRPRVTEETFSFDTILRIFDSFTNDDKLEDRGFFRNRDPETSKAYQLVVNSIANMAANQTRSCILSSFTGHMKKFRDTSIRRITSSNSMDFSEFDSDKPIALFVSYKDEDALHYHTISLFFSDLYTKLIELARSKGGKLARPCYFMLDEFGNFPEFSSFENVISACGGRNIWFLLVVQSYAQLYKIYGKETTAIILDNLNMHIFFGSANRETKEAFSRECGLHSVFSPNGVLNGERESISNYDVISAPLIPVSRLDELPEGECIITQMRSPVIWSRIERSYLCPEFSSVAAELKKPEARRFAKRPIYKLPQSF